MLWCVKVQMALNCVMQSHLHHTKHQGSIRRHQDDQGNYFLDAPWIKHHARIKFHTLLSRPDLVWIGNRVSPSQTPTCKASVNPASTGTLLERMLLGTTVVTAECEVESHLGECA